MPIHATYDHHGRRTVELPFDHITARAIIVRRADGFLLGLLHRPDGRYAPAGGQMEDGESPDHTVLRELAEEGIELIAPDPRWRDWLVADAHLAGGTLNIWYLFLVDDANIGPNPEVIDTRWIDPAEDAWYPAMREKMQLAIRTFIPELA